MKKSLLLLLCLFLAACSQQEPNADQKAPAAPDPSADASESTSKPAASVPAVSDSTPKPAASEPEKKLEEADYYVSPSGSDDNPGTFEKPFKTIQKAADVATAGQVVAVRGGVYRESVIPKHSGTAGKPIVFKSYADEVALISGTEVVEDWERAALGRYKAKWGQPFESLNNQAMQLFADGKMMIEARYPNLPSLDSIRPVRLNTDKVVNVEVIERIDERNVTARITIESEGFQQPKGRWDGAQINIRAMWSWGWGMPRTATIVSSEPGRLTFDFPNYEIHDLTKGNGTIVRDNANSGMSSPFFVFGAEEGVDAPGEWFYNEKSGEFTFLPPKELDMDEAVIEVKMRDWAFDLSERSYITIKGFHLFGTSITTDRESGTGNPVFEPYAEIRMDTVAPSSNIIIDGINARYVTHFTRQDGYILSQWSNNSGIVLSGTNQELKNSVIAYSAGNLVSLIGDGNKVTNNILHYAGYSGSEIGFVGTGCFKTTSINHQISYNTMYTCGGNGIHTNMKGTNPDKPARINNNIIHDVGTMRADIGFVYSFGGRDGSWNSIDHNLMYGSTTFQGFGIYFDYGKYWHINNNILFDVSWATCTHTNAHNGGQDMKFWNNVLWSLGHYAHGNGHGVDATGTEFINGIYHGKRVDEIPGTRVENNFITEKDYHKITDIFVDPYGLDFRLKDSIDQAIDKGLKHERYASDYNGSAPDLGAVEKGEEMFRVGSTLEPIVRAPSHLSGKRTNEGVALAWRDNADNEQEYIIERSTKADDGYMYNIEWEQLTVLPADSTEYVDTAAPGGLVYYRVRAPEARMTNLVRID